MSTLKLFSGGDQTLCKYERIRLERISEREAEWQKLMKYKTEFDSGIKKKTSKKANKPPESASLVLRRSVRKKLTVSYKEDYTPGRQWSMRS